MSASAKSIFPFTSELNLREEATMFASTTTLARFYGEAPQSFEEYNIVSPDNAVKVTPIVKDKELMVKPSDVHHSQTIGDHDRRI